MKKVGLSGCLMLLLSFSFVWSAPPQTIRIPVTFYDFHPNGQNDFEMCMGNGTKNMVELGLDADRKPIPTGVACPANPVAAPCACHLKQWFRVSGGAATDYDHTLKFICDSTSDPKRITRYWYWASNPLAKYPGDLRPYPLAPVAARPGEFVGPNFDPNNIAANVIIYDSLEFAYQPGTQTYQIWSTNFFPLDNRGFGNEPAAQNPPHNFAFAMEMHTVFKYKPGLVFNFEGDDDVWAFINGRLVMDLGGLHTMLPGSVNLDTMGLQVGKNYNFDFFYLERHTTGADIKITTNLLNPPSELSTNIYPDSTIHAGEVATVIGKLTDQSGAQFDSLNNQIRWTIDPATKRPGDSLIGPLQNDTIKVTGTEAWHTVTVIGTYTEGGLTLIGKARIRVIPGPPAQVDIVKQNLTHLPKNQIVITHQDSILPPKPVQTVYFASSDKQHFVYATIEDAYGNFIQLADGAAWITANADTSVKMAFTPNDASEGIINRNTILQTTMKIIVSQGTLKPDTAIVNLMNDVVDSLRIVEVSPIPTGPLDTIKMTTDDRITVKLIGHFSTKPAGQWDTLSGVWSLSNGTITFVNPVSPNETDNWTIDPITPGTTVITVTFQGKTVKVPLVISPAPPSKVELALVTNPDSCYAGQPIKIVAKISNTDGLVPGSYNASALYGDILKQLNALRPGFPPIVKIDNANGTLESAMAEQFVNGIDTFSVVLYYAALNPPPDTLHQITVELNGTPSPVGGPLKASTIPFVLHPGPISQIQIADQAQNHITPTDTIKLSTAQPMKTLFIKAYDPYGNLIDYSHDGGTPLSTVLWRPDGTLDRPQKDSVGYVFTYDASAVLFPESGNIYSILTLNNKTFIDTVRVIVTPPAPIVNSACTRDLNGNGLIDEIDLTFNKKTVLTPADVNKIAISKNGVWTIASIVPFTVNGLPDSTRYKLILTERQTSTDPNNPVPQTSWRPTITFNNIATVQNGTTTALDSCPPVVWDVMNSLSKDGNHSKDTIAVTFSEKIVDPLGNDFLAVAGHQPVLTFWAYNLQGDTLKKMFEGITTYLKNPSTYVFTSSGDTGMTVYFLMSNGQLLNDQNLVNILTPSSQIKDKNSGNVPTPVNQKVRVRMKGPPIITIYPNPSPSNFTRIPPGFLDLVHNDNARTWVKNDHSGIVISLGNIFRPSADQGTVKAYLKIYDVVGNIVNSATTNDLLKLNSGPSVQQTVDIYWNGSNAKGMKVAPGVYRTVVYVEYPPKSGYGDAKFINMVGISR
jgi:fibro-slime domain-containing protein